MNFNQKAAAFLRSHKTHTSAAVAITLAGIEHILEHRDWTGMAKIIDSVEPRMARRMLQMIGMAIGGVTKTTKDGKTVFKLGENFGATEKIADLRALVADGTSIFAEAMDKYLGLEPAAPVEFSLEKRAAVLVRKAIAADAGITERDFLTAMLTAYRAVRKDVQAAVNA